MVPPKDTQVCPKPRLYPVAMLVSKDHAAIKVMVPPGPGPAAESQVWVPTAARVYVNCPWLLTSVKAMPMPGVWAAS